MALVKYNDNSISAVTSTALAEGSLVPIKTLTASSSATLSFVHGSNDVILDSTYPIYKFEFINIHQSQTSFAYSGGDDLAQSTSFQRLGLPGYNNDESMVGEMFLFSPSSTTFVKHFMSRTNGYYTGNSASWSEFVSGYCNTTTAIDGVQFKMSGGNIDSGKIK